MVGVVNRVNEQLAEEIFESAINESKIYYLSQWAMSAIDNARAQRFEEVVDEAIVLYRKMFSVYVSSATKSAIAQSLQEYYEQETR